MMAFKCVASVMISWIEKINKKFNEDSMACINCILVLFHQYQYNLVKHSECRAATKKKRHSTIIINLSGKATQTSSFFGFIVII